MRRAGTTLDVTVPMHVVVVTGHNEATRQKLQAVPVPPRHRRTILGFTHEIDELMAAADLAVAKPGGLTTSEALARGLPLAIVYPVPGQEDRNSDYLENGAAIKINHLPTLAFESDAGSGRRTCAGPAKGQRAPHRPAPRSLRSCRPGIGAAGVRRPLVGG